LGSIIDRVIWEIRCKARGLGTSLLSRQAEFYNGMKSGINYPSAGCGDKSGTVDNGQVAQSWRGSNSEELV